MKQLTIKIHDELHRQFKMECARAGKKMTALIVSAIEAWVEAQKKK